MDILIIGTEPVCPRCDLMVRRVREVMGATPGVVVRHCAFDDPEAVALGATLGCHMGTAHQVAEAAGIAVDWAEVKRLVTPAETCSPFATRPADLWTPELDRILEPCQRAAVGAGYLMTPVLVADGRVVHHGSVPSVAELRAWLDC